MSSLSFPFYSSSKQKRTNYKLSAVSFLSFLHSFLFLSNILKFDKGQSITRKCKNPTPYVEQEDKQFVLLVWLLPNKWAKNKQTVLYRQLYVKPDKRFSSVIWCYCSIQNLFKVWLQEEAIPLLPEVVSSHLASTVITVLLVYYKLWIVFRNHRRVFSLQRGSELLLFVLWCTPIQ